MNSLVLAAALAAAITPGGAAMAMTALENRSAIVDTITDIAAGADRHDWARVRGAFANQVTVDYTSLWGGEPVTQGADALVEQWSSFLPGFDATTHLVTNHSITEMTADTAIAEADFQALHRIGSEQWVLFGRYSYELIYQPDGWKVRRMAMTWTHETGDRGLVAVAGERAKTLR